MYQIQYTGDGVATEFEFNFPFFKSADVKVSVNSEILNSGAFTVTFSESAQNDGMYSGGRIIFTDAPALGAAVRIWRKIDLSRVIDYQPTLPIQTDSLNADFNFMLEFLKDLYELDGDIPNIENGMQFLESIQDQIENLGDFGELARKDEIPDTSNFATKDEIPDVSNFVTKDEIPDATDFATKDEIPDVTNFATKDEIPDVSNFALINHTHDMSAYITQQTLTASLNAKQDVLTTQEQQAVDSGITTNKVAAYDAYAGQITGKIDKQQGIENSGKVLQIGTDGLVVPMTISLPESGGLLSVDHDVTLTGAGTNISPLGVACGEQTINKVSNCILQNPKNINLKIENGALTLKAGSIAYVPNGAGVFNKKTAQIDVVLNTNLSAGTYLVCDNGYFSGESLRCSSIQDVVSSPSEPPSPSSNLIWYDTVGNKIMIYQGNAWTGARSLPIAVIDVSSSGTITIKQVFDGFGFIGTTVFTLPGLQVSAPNGINSDGTLNNISTVQTSVNIYTVQNMQDTAVFANANNLLVSSENDYIYNELDNTLTDQNGNIYPYAKIATLQNDGTRIIGINTKNVCRLIDFDILKRELETKQDILQAGEHIIISGNTISATGGVKSDLSNIDDNIDFVTSSQLPSAANNYTWYRKYKSGWVEQGGYVMPPTVATNSVTLPIPMADAYYSIVQGIAGFEEVTGYDTGFRNQTPTGFLFICRYAGTSTVNYGYWFVAGMAA